MSYFNTLNVADVLLSEPLVLGCLRCRRPLHLYWLLISERHWKIPSLLLIPQIPEVVLRELPLRHVLPHFHLLRLGHDSPIIIASLQVLVALVRLVNNCSLDDGLLSVDMLGNLGRHILKLLHFPIRLYTRNQTIKDTYAFLSKLPPGDFGC